MRLTLVGMKDLEVCRCYIVNGHQFKRNQISWGYLNLRGGWHVKISCCDKKNDISPICLSSLALVCKGQSNFLFFSLTVECEACTCFTPKTAKLCNASKLVQLLVEQFFLDSKFYSPSHLRFFLTLLCASRIPSPSSFHVDPQKFWIVWTSYLFA